MAFGFLSCTSALVLLLNSAFLPARAGDFGEEAEEGGKAGGEGEGAAVVAALGSGSSRTGAWGTISPRGLDLLSRLGLPLRHPSPAVQVIPPGCQVLLLQAVQQHPPGHPCQDLCPKAAVGPQSKAIRLARPS